MDPYRQHELRAEIFIDQVGERYDPEKPDHIEVMGWIVDQTTEDDDEVD